MKKILFRFVLLSGIAMLLSSCFFMIPLTRKMTLDENVPLEQSVIITFKNSTDDGYFWLREWNGNDITEDVISKRVSSKDRLKLTVPAGENIFTFDARYTFSSQYSSKTHNFDNIELRYILEPGKEYQIKGRTKFLGLFKGYELFVGIYDVTNRSTLLKEWKLGET